MHDLEAVANLNAFLWLAPFGIVIGLALASVYRALSIQEEPRTYATAAALCLGALVVGILFLALPYLVLAILAILGLGTWIASVIVAPARLLWAEAVIVPIAVTVVWMVL